MALTNTEIIWLGRDNSVDLHLYSGTTAVDLTAVTEIRLSLGDVVVSSTDSTGGLITWGISTYATGEIRMALGGSSDLSTGRYTGRLVVFDPSNSSGLVWDDDIPIRIKADPLTT